jgi:hypothetical protein
MRAALGSPFGTPDGDLLALALMTNPSASPGLLIFRTSAWKRYSYLSVTIGGINRMNFLSRIR